jgi:hypothetical protein
LKLLRNLVLAVVLVVVGAVVVVMWQGESIVAAGIEEFGPEVTGTTVEVGDVSIGPLTGSASLEDLVVSNPAGFTEPHSLRLGEISTSLDIQSLFSEKVVIHSVEVINPEFTFELGDDTQNLTRINENVQAFVGPEEAAGDAPQTLFVIEDFHLKGAKVKVAGLGVKALNQEITLPDLHLQGIGEKENGVLAADAAKQIFAAVTDLVKKELVKAQATGLISDTLKLPGGIGGSTFDNVKSKIKGFFSR